MKKVDLRRLNCYDNQIHFSGRIALAGVTRIMLLAGASRDVLLEGTVGPGLIDMKDWETVSYKGISRLIKLVALDSFGERMLAKK